MDLKELEKINFHDADIYSYVRKGNNIYFELKDGWNEKCYYKIKLIISQLLRNNSSYSFFDVNTNNIGKEAFYNCKWNKR